MSVNYNNIVFPTEDEIIKMSVEKYGDDIHLYAQQREGYECGIKELINYLKSK